MHNLRPWEKGNVHTLNKIAWWALQQRNPEQINLPSMSDGNMAATADPPIKYPWYSWIQASPFGNHTPSRFDSWKVILEEDEC